MTFEMFKPKFNNKKQRLSFKIDAGIINNRESDLVTGSKGKVLNEVTLFIDDATLETAASSPSSASHTAFHLIARAFRAPATSGTWLDEVLSSFLNDAPGGDSDVVLSNVNLIGADLTNADLSGANLKGAELWGAVLTNASLTDSDLTGANLSGANLTYPDLSGAILIDATSDSTTTWPTAKYWNNTSCPDGSNSDTNPSCGF